MTVGDGRLDVACYFTPNFGTRLAVTNTSW